MSDAPFPRLFGKYVLLRPLARGGMGELYLAATGELGGAEKLCVIKKLPEADSAAPGDPSKMRRMMDEARVMARLSHSNLVQVFDTGLVGGELYLAMELVAGRDLRAAWNRCADLGARIPVDLALYVVREVARGLAYAHSYGGLHLVHRDIAPPNILCSWQGEVKITDFGLAASRIKSEKTGPGMVFGRIGYLAPEQAQGAAADHRADIYALGVILWELLTGQPLIEPTLEPAEALRAVRTMEAAPPSRYAPDLPPSLDQVVLRALRPRREERFASADEMRQAVSRELLRLAPDVDQGCVASFLRELYGDEIEREQREHERLLREELPKVRAPRPPLLGVGGLTAVRSESAVQGAWPMARPPLQSAPPDVSQRIMQIIDGRYRIERLIGCGGMGAVYEAEHMAIRKKVALKILHRPFSQQADLVARFRREAQAASRVGHPNIIDVTDFGYTPDGSAYLVMEHLTGMDLGQVLGAGRRLPIQRALRIAVQLVQALAAAHQAGVIHRDLKPENIFLLHPEESEGPAERGQPSPLRDFVKVLDFGIAMRIEPSVPIRLTEPGLTVGTPSYMAPEQATGARVDGRADIYAVGTILYEMIGGRVPFEDTEPPSEMLLRKVREPPPPLSALEPNVPPRLEALIMRCLEREPARRPQTMGELLEELQAAQAELAPRPGAVWIGPERSAHPLASEPTVPFSTAEHGALLPQRAAPAASVGEPPRPSSPSAPISPSQRSVQRHLRPGYLLFGAGAGVLLVSAGFLAARYLPTPPHQRAASYLEAPRPVPSTLESDSSPASALRSDPSPPRTAAPSPGPEAALLEWARRAAEGHRYMAPPGDNLAELLERVEAIAPGHPEAHRLREQAVQALGLRARDQMDRKDVDGALASYRALSALRADAPFPRAELAQLLLQQARAIGRKNRMRALQSAQGAVEVSPESVPARLLLAELCLQAGQWDRALAEYRHVLMLHPDRLQERAARTGLAKAAARRKRR
ncbi:MAG: protein kinase [Myxococcales bacterium]|nr:protein kinase [Myxococcota bacterium]MDW8282753.1 protein kinase [Myxococcales bacterium]